jgi:hypothetical protein
MRSASLLGNIDSPVTAWIVPGVGLCWVAQTVRAWDSHPMLRKVSSGIFRYTAASVNSSLRRSIELRIL